MAPIFYFDGTHLISPCLDDLHFIAGEIGLNKRYFQDRGHYIPHYDVWELPKEKLLQFGSVIMVNTKELVEIGRKYYNKRRTL